MRRRPRPLPQRDRQLRACLPAGLDLPREGRHLHQCRAPHQPGAQGDGAEERATPTGKSPRSSRRRWGMAWNYTHPSEIMDEIAADDAELRRRLLRLLDREGSVQWPCNEKAPLGTPIMHIDGFVRGKGKFIRTEYVATDEKTGPRFPLLLTTGRILSQYNVGAQTRRTDNVVWHQEDRLEIHPHDAEQRGIRDGDWVRIAEPRRRDDAARADHRARGAGRGLHDLPPPGHAGQRHHHRLLRLGDQLPGIQGDGRAGRARPTARPTGRTSTTSRRARAGASRAGWKRRSESSALGDPPRLPGISATRGEISCACREHSPWRGRCSRRDSGRVPSPQDGGRLASPPAIRDTASPAAPRHGAAAHGAGGDAGRAFLCRHHACGDDGHARPISRISRSASRLTEGIIGVAGRDRGHRASRIMAPASTSRSG